MKGSKIGAIAQGAGVTTAMLHYYFENKEGLYKAVLQRPGSEISEVIANLDLNKLPPEEAF